MLQLCGALHASGREQTSPRHGGRSTAPRIASVAASTWFAASVSSSFVIRSSTDRTGSPPGLSPSGRPAPCRRSRPACASPPCAGPRSPPRCRPRRSRRWAVAEEPGALLLGERPDQPGQRLLVPPARQVDEVARELEHHPLPRRLGRPRRPQALEEVARLDAERPGDAVEQPGREAVDAPLVLVGLLVGGADPLGELLLGEAERDAALAHLGPDVAVGVLGPRSTASLRRALGHRGSLPGFFCRAL